MKQVLFSDKHNNQVQRFI